MAEKDSFTSKAAKYALGLHRGPPDGEAELDKTHSLETGEKKTPMQKVRKHWARFWCCYCFWSVIFLAIFLPIFFLVIIPAIAQNVVNRSTLLLTRADVMQPRPDSVMLTIESALDLPIDLPVRIEPIALELFNRATRDEGGNGTYAVLYIDGKVIDGNTTLGVENQFTPLNVEEWTKYVHDVVFMKNGPLSVYGQTNSFLGKLKSFVTMDKDIPQYTLNSFDGFAIEDSTLILPPKEDGTNLIANATLPNPSVLTLEIGKTILDLKSGDLIIGNATIDNLILRPGNHSAPVHGILDLSTLINNLGEVIRTQGDSLTQGFLSLDTVGKSVVYDGVEIPYYTQVMSELVMTAKVSIADLLKNTLSEMVHGGGNNGTGGLLSALNGTLGEAASDPNSGVGNVLSEIKRSDGLTSETVDAFLKRHQMKTKKRSGEAGALGPLVDLLEAFV